MSFIEFLEFLNKNCYAEFSQIIYFKYKMSVKNYYKSIDKSEIRYIFEDSFPWSKTPQGINYWIDINDKFTNIIKQKLKENFGK